MCTPVAAIAAVGVAGAVVQGAAAASARNTEASNYDSRANLQDRQSDIEKKTGEYQAQRLEERVSRIIGDQRATYASNGIALSGSAADVVEESALEGALDAEAIRWNSDLAASNYQLEAKVSRNNAAATRGSAGSAFLAPVINSFARFGSAF